MNVSLFGPKKLGFGMMRLPMIPGENGAPDRVDTDQVCRMVDDFIARGFCYFDTAHGYLGGLSEQAVRTCLSSRYPRDRYLLTDKLSDSFFHKEEDIRPFLESQLEACCVEYFDFYLLHALSRNNYEQFCRCNAFEVAQQLKAEGKIRHVGFSFHDKPEFLDRVLTEHPEIEAVQIQFNYADFEDPDVQSHAVYDVCRRHSKPVIIMEPVKGGRLAQLPAAAAAELEKLHGGSAASYAVRFAASFEGVEMVLSGMSSAEQMQDNLSYMQDFRPLDGAEKAAVARACTVLKSQDIIPCTNCRYCVAGCPKNILIPDLFACLNARKQYQDWDRDFYYRVTTEGHGKASDCIRCGQCEHECPQHLEIRELLKKVAAAFENA